MYLYIFVYTVTKCNMHNLSAFVQELYIMERTYPHQISERIFNWFSSCNPKLFAVRHIHHPVNTSSYHFHTDEVVPSSDHCHTQTVLPPSDHYCIETVSPSGDHYCIDIVVPSSDHCSLASRLRWFGHVKRHNQEYIRRQTLEMVPPRRRRRGRPNQRWMGCVNRDMIAVGTTKDEVRDRTGWRRIVSDAANGSR